MEMVFLDSCRTSKVVARRPQDVQSEANEGACPPLPLTACSCRIVSAQDSAAIRTAIVKPRPKDSSRSRRTDADSLSLTNSDSISRNGLRDANRERLTQSQIDAACSRGRNAASGSLSMRHILPKTTTSSIPHERQRARTATSGGALRNGG